MPGNHGSNLVQPEYLCFLTTAVFRLLVKKKIENLTHAHYYTDHNAAILAPTMAAKESAQSAAYLISPQTTITGTNVTVKAWNQGQGVPGLRTSLLTPGQVNTPRRPVAHPGSGAKVIPKVLLKCVSRVGTKKKDSKTFSIRDISPSAVTSCGALKGLIRAQLGDDVEDDFDIGYQTGSAVVNIRCSVDLREVWESILTGTNVTLWCDGLKTPGSTSKKKRKRTEYSDDDDIEDFPKRSSRPKKKKKDSEELNAAIDSIIKELKELHGNGTYTPMQYRVWAEMHYGEVHPSLTDPPTSSMFIRVGNNPTSKKKTLNDPLTEAITHIASALSPGCSSTPQTSTGHGTSPAKVIDYRSKCYRQLSDVSNLR